MKNIKSIWKILKECIFLHTEVAIHHELKDISHFMVVKQTTGSNEKLYEMNTFISWFFSPILFFPIFFSSFLFSSLPLLSFFPILTWYDFFLVDSFSVGSIVSNYIEMYVLKKFYSNIQLNPLNVFGLESSWSLTYWIMQAGSYDLSSSILPSSISIILLIISLNFYFL